MIRPFSELQQKASKFSQQIQDLQDEALTHKIITSGDDTYAFIASLGVGRTVQMEYAITRNAEPVYGIAELPVDILASYGLFVACVQEWVNGGELHESLRQDDQPI